jgi:hypothetical protein
MAETIGSIVDKICIAELKRFYMQKQVERPEVSDDHRQKCQDRVNTITLQRDDLVQELNGLIQLWSEGRWTPKVYRQFKMYNDPKYKSATPAARAR